MRFDRLTSVRFILVGLSIPYTFSRLIISNQHFNGSSLSVTSIHFQKRFAAEAVWVSRVLGKDAVFWGEAKIPRGNGTLKARENFANNLRLASADIQSAFDRIRNHASDDIECAISILGFTRLSSAAPPFRGREDRRVGPSLGVAYLSGDSFHPKHANTVECVYRAVYCNFRHTESSQSFWAVPFYCPVQKQQRAFCEALSKTDTSDNMNLEMKLRDGKIWTTKFGVTATDECNPISGCDKFAGTPPADSSKNGEGLLPTQRFKAAVCTVWPYHTSRTDKAVINQALVFEFLRHYAMLGMAVLVYDRDGVGMRNAFETTYARAKKRDDVKLRQIIDSALVYHNFTIHSLLNPQVSRSPHAGAVEFDMEDAHMHHDRVVNADKAENVSPLQLLDNDKELTYTHCRFEAQHQFGISRVLVVDFDEFLYCKAAAARYAAQAQYLHALLDRLHQQDNMEQVMFGKTTLQPRHPHAANESILECLQQEVAGAGSVFNCFSSAHCVHSKPNVKSVHLQYVCPYTGMHHACGGCTLENPMCKQHEQKHRFYDCHCATSTFDECDFLHLSAVASKYSTGTAIATAAAIASAGSSHRDKSRIRAAGRKRPRVGGGEVDVATRSCSDHGHSGTAACELLELSQSP